MFTSPQWGRSSPPLSTWHVSIGPLHSGEDLSSPTVYMACFHWQVTWHVSIGKLANGNMPCRQWGKINLLHCGEENIFYKFNAQMLHTLMPQGYATVFVAKFFGRAGLMSFLSAIPVNQRHGINCNFSMLS
ncbi:Uncharacterized protein Fot_06439 [Forsythia ovata]|uniref:Uncharacterized protein n=1 Tax=Forsythia ovata TaxID=205694 RepID=A0ABD1WTM8_9LAMI